jgi:hypothetical protein
MASIQHRVVARDHHGCVVESRTFAGRRQALHFADAQLALHHEVELNACPPTAACAPDLPLEAGASWSGIRWRTSSRS